MLKIGHRGAKGYEPENTLLSIKKAIEQGVNAVEIDVHRTKDNKIVVIHDDKVDRTTDGKGFVKDMTLEQLKKLDAGKKEKIPTLQEVIDLVKGKIKLIVEIKQKNIYPEIARIIKNNGMYENCYVISFWHDEIKKIKEFDENIHTGVLMVGCPVSLGFARNIKAEALVMNYQYVDSDFVEMCHEDNLKVFVWNINEKELIKEYVKMRVDGISSDFPDILTGLK